MQAGKLRHPLTIQRLSLAPTTRDDHGGMREDWLDVANTWGSVEPIRAVEIFRANQVDARITHRIMTRYCSGVDASMRVKFGERVFLLLSVVNVEERNIMLEMLAMETA